MLIRYGEKVACYEETEDGETVPRTVIDLIDSDLKADNIRFHDALHRRILEEAIRHEQDTGFSAERYFITHPEAEISQLAANLVSDRYQLSKYHSKAQKIITDEERLYELIPRLLLDFKLSIVEEELAQILRSLADPNIANDPQRCMEMMQRYKELHETQSLMAQKAGDRVILKL